MSGKMTGRRERDWLKQETRRSSRGGRDYRLGRTKDSKQLGLCGNFGLLYRTLGGSHAMNRYSLTSWA